MIVFNGMMALGSAGWGVVAGAVGISWAFLLSAAGLLLFELATARWRIPGGEAFSMATTKAAESGIE